MSRKMYRAATRTKTPAKSLACAVHGAFSARNPRRWNLIRLLAQHRCYQGDVLTSTAQLYLQESVRYHEGWGRRRMQHPGLSLLPVCPQARKKTCVFLHLQRRFWVTNLGPAPARRRGHKGECIPAYGPLCIGPPRGGCPSCSTSLHGSSSRSSLLGSVPSCEIQILCRRRRSCCHSRSCPALSWRCTCLSKPGWPGRGLSHRRSWRSRCCRCSFCRCRRRRGLPEAYKAK